MSRIVQGLQGQPSGAHFLILLLKTVGKLTFLISLGILLHILAAIFAVDPIAKCIEWMFDLGSYHTLIHKRSSLENQKFRS